MNNLPQNEKNPILRLKGEKVSLAPVTPECAGRWAAWLNDLEVTIPLGCEASSPITLQSQQKAVSDLEDSHAYSIIENNSGKDIGRIMLFRMNPVDRNSTVGLFIGEKEYWNRGYGEEAMRLMLDYGFYLLNLNSIMLGVYSPNKRAIKCYKKVGFKEIGIRRQAKIFQNRKYDALLMDILAEEYKPYLIHKLIEKAFE